MAAVGERRMLLIAFYLLAIIIPVFTQTYSTCNPLTQGGCPADPALSKSVTVDFTKGASSEFTASGAPTYGSDGAQFTIARSGDSPTITSKWYMMFGHVEFVLKAAPGTGIVSSAILQSDDLDELDFEWLGGDNTQVQSNYFGKGLTVSGYNRGAFHGAANNHDQFHTYTIDWTAEQIVWQIDGTTVRVLTPATAEANQYPQTPMMIKVGIWAGGDPANAQGTIQWAGGQTDYTAGPYSMYLKSIHASDYSTGTSYSYVGTDGTWQSIKSNGGTVNSNGKDTPAVSSSPPVTTATGAPIPLTTDASASSIYATRTGFPWIIGTTTLATTTATAPYTSIAGLPSGWSINSSGKVVPPSTGSGPSPSTSSLPASWSAYSLPASETEVLTSYDSLGLPTLVTVTTAIAGSSKTYASVLTTSDTTSSLLSPPGPTSTISRTTHNSTGAPTSPTSSSVLVPGAVPASAAPVLAIRHLWRMLLTMMVAEVILQR